MAILFIILSKIKNLNFQVLISDFDSLLNFNYKIFQNNFILALIISAH